MKKIITTILYCGLTFSCCAQVPNLWGMTWKGGSNNDGAIIKIYEDGSNFQTVFSFDSISGIEPFASPLFASNGLIYATTGLKGVFNYGTLFSFDTNTLSLNVLHNFIDSTGRSPRCSLIKANNGKLYGTATLGGAHGSGVLFSYDLNLNTYTDLFDFSSGSLSNNELVQSNNGGLLFGMDYNGGLYSDGFIYSYDILHDTLIDLFDFNDTLGKFPMSSLIQLNNGKFYGMTNQGGLNHFGVIFSFDPTTNLYEVLYNFNAQTGDLPQGNLFKANDGLLYGLTSNSSANGIGVLFRFDITTNTYDTLHTFLNSSGFRPLGSLIQGVNGKLFGMTSSGGAHHLGVVFSYDIALNTYMDLHDFTGLDGSSPFGNLVEGNPGSVGISIFNNESGISIYPNPANTILNIRNQLRITNEELRIMDVLGNKVYSQLLTNSTESTIDISNLSNGIYFYEVRSSNETARGKFIVQH